MPGSTSISMTGDNRGIVVGQDIKDANLINAGDVIGNNNTIIAGANVVLHQIQQARSAIAEAEAGIRLAEMQLADAVTRKIQQLTQAVAKSATSERRNPYKSLLDYQLEDTAYFYGRDNAIHELLGKIHDHRLTILHADSGSGKSSLLQAGLMSRLLAAGHLPLRLRPYQQEPTLFIKKTFLSDVETLPELDRFQKMSLVGYLQAVTAYLGNSTLYLFLDQFEEFFTELSRTNQEKFAQELADCLDNTGLDVRWVISLRKEQFSDLSLFQPRIAPFANEFFLPTFKIAEAKDIITKPAHQFGVDYESTLLVDTILADLREEDGTLQPPQIQIVCYNLFDETLASATPSLISADLYNQPRGRGFPGAQGILSHHLTRTLARMHAPERKLASHILEILVSSGKRRIRINRSNLALELAAIHESDPTTTDQVLAQLVNDRLLRLDEDENDEPLYELTHDYLLGEIELDEETLKRKFAQELLNQQVAAWRADNKIRIAQETLEIIEKQENALRIETDSAELLLLSREAIGRRRRIVQSSYGAAGVALVAALIMGLIALGLWQLTETVRNDLNQSTLQAASIRLANDASEQMAEGRCDLAWLLTRESLEVMGDNLLSPSVDASARRLLRSPACPWTLPHSFHAGGAGIRGYSPDGTKFLTIGSIDGTMRVWDAQTYRQVYWAEEEYAVRDALFSPDSRQVLIRYHDRPDPLQLWDLSSNLSVWSKSEVRAGGFPVEFNVTGDQLLIRGSSFVQILKTADGNEHFYRELDGVTAAAFSRDAASTKLFVASASGLQVFNTRTGTQLTTIPTAAYESIDSVSPLSLDGRRVYLATTTNILEIDLETKQPRPLLAEQTEAIQHVLYSADGKLVMTAGTDTVRVWHIDSGQPATDPFAFNFTLGTALSADGAYLAFVDNDNKIQLWDIRNKQALSIPVGNGLSAQSPDQLVFSPDSSRLLINYGGVNAIHEWRIGNAEATQPVIGIGVPAGSVAFNSSGTQALTTYSDGTSRIWNVVNGRTIHRLDGQQAAITLGRFSADDQRVLTADISGTVLIWAAVDGQLLQRLPHSGGLWSAQFGADHNLLLTTSIEDGFVHLWDVEKGTEQRLLDAQLNGPVSEAMFFQNDQQIVTVEGQTLRLWDITQARELARFHDDAPIIAIASGLDYTYLRSVNQAGAVKEWSLVDGEQKEQSIWCCLDTALGVPVFDTTGRFLAQPMVFDVEIWDIFRQTQLVNLPNSEVVINDIAFRPDGTQLITAQEDGITKIYPILGGDSKPLALASGEKFIVRSASFNADRSRLLTLGFDHMTLWNVVTQQELFPLPIHNAVIRNFGFNFSGTKLIVLSADDHIMVIDATTGALLTALDINDKPIRAVSLLADENSLLIFRNDDILRWDIQENRQITQIFTGEQGLIPPAITRDGARIALQLRNQSITVWDAAGNQSFQLEGGGSSVHWIGVDPQDRYFVTRPFSGMLKIWSTADGTLLKALPNAGGITSVEPHFSPNGKYMVSAAVNDNSLILWETDSFAEKHTLRGHQEKIAYVEFSHDSTKILTRSDDNTVRIWDVASGDQLRLFSESGYIIREAVFSADDTVVIALLSSSTNLLPSGRNTTPEISIRRWRLYDNQQWLTVIGDQIGREPPIFWPEEYAQFNIGQRPVEQSKSTFQQMIELWQAQFNPTQ